MNIRKMLDEHVDSFKYFVSLLIFLLNGVSSYLPLRVKNVSWMSRAESLAGGIFLGAGMVHLIPEALHSFEGVSHYPISMVIALIFFSLLLTIEMFASSHSHDNKNGENLIEQNESAKVIKEEVKTVPFTKENGNIDNATLLIYFILIFHGFVEAVAFGLMKEGSIILALFCAIIGHKPVETFALGLMILKCKPSKGKYILMMFIFCLIAPITIVLMMYVGKFASSLFFGFVASASSGVFLFVGFHEITEMFHKSHKWSSSSKLWHLCSFMIGLVWMSVMALFGGEHHH